jgi:hypothetical protein
MKTKILQNTKSIILALILTLCVGYVSASSTWVGPSVAAPGNNTDTPLNTGSTAQTKNGNLNVHNGYLQAYSDSGPYGLLNYGGYGVYTNNSVYASGPSNNWAGVFSGGGPYGIYTINSSGYYDYLAYSSWGLLTNGNVNASDYYIGATGQWLSTALSNLTNGYASSAGSVGGITGRQTAVYSCPEIYYGGGCYGWQNECIGQLSASSTCQVCSGGSWVRTGCSFAGYLTN